VIPEYQPSVSDPETSEQIVRYCACHNSKPTITYLNLHRLTALLSGMEALNRIQINSITSDGNFTRHLISALVVMIFLLFRSFW
jgi:hypothetical protein